MTTIKIQQTFFSLAHNYKLFSHPEGQEIGIARGKMFKIRSSYTVNRPDGTRWFKIQRNLWKTKYTITDEQGRYIAHYRTPFIALFTKKLFLVKDNIEYPTKGSFWALNFEVFSHDNRQLMSVNKKFFQVRDSFLVEYLDDFDPRLAISAAIVADDRYHPSK